MQNPRAFATADTDENASEDRGLILDEPAIHRTRARRNPKSFRSKRANIHRRSRAKRHVTWEQIELESHGLYAENLHILAIRFPTLTPMELRVTTLAKAMFKNWQIAEKLCIQEKTVENHRNRIRRKLGIVSGSLQRHLIES